MQHQADERRVLGHKNPNKTSMYEQGKNMGSSIVDQKHKHCNPNKPALPSSSDNGKHIINALELIPERFCSLTTITGHTSSSSLLSPS